MQDEKSQIQNRARALQVLERLLKLEQDKQAAELSDARRSQVGGGGRSEKIRTYNFKDNRVTDHRIGLTLYKLDRALAGELDEVIDALVADERTRQLAGTAGSSRRLDLIVSATPRLLSRREAQWIAEQASGGDLDAAPPKVAAALRAMVTGAAGEPLQYVLGSWSFRELDLWSTAVLIPRPETEQVVEQALIAALLIDSGRVLRIADLGTGSWRDRAVARARAPLGREIWATDVSEDAPRSRRRTSPGWAARRGRAGRAGGGFVRAPGCSGRSTSSSRTRRMSRTTSASSGCRAGARECARRGTDRPRSDRAHRARGHRWLLVPRRRGRRDRRDPGDAVAALARAAGFTDVTVHQDLAGRDRILTASRHL
jgi:methylase of polypeptide subunit release factors